MRLHIIGKGAVGTATGEGFRRFGNEITYTDKGDDHNAVEADIHFVCVPEHVVPEVVRGLVRPIPWTRETMGLIVVRSTVPPGTCAALADELRRPILHNPEWLRESTAHQDFLNTDRVLLGWNFEEYKASTDPLLTLEELYEPFGAPIFRAFSTVTEMVKLLTNNHLAMLISFWNEAKTLCDAARINSHAVARLVALDKRVSLYGAVQHGAPYGGKCLPKDSSQLRTWAAEHAIPIPLLYAVHEINVSLGGA